ncbi:hypothetical protein [Eubacterium oxidoreducens]|uniref:Uncharacterized protein n=1 Tax=Eubacterium oxidoreducens TaxID=1732 RepID=A0A1G6AXH8_EUBOX|nr:hypothetical protein [Eubacterium oxidoreducens]SDB13107.1 hypothetical protein SAMN02910417_01002 [Eubacterium oxidoreducens]
MNYMKKLGSLLCAASIAVTGVFALQMPANAQESVPELVEYEEGEEGLFYFGSEEPSLNTDLGYSDTVAVYAATLDNEKCTITGVNMPAYDMSVPSTASYGDNTYSVEIGSGMHFKEMNYQSISFVSYEDDKVSTVDTDLSEWFMEDTALESVDLSGLELTGVTAITDMFKDCTSLTTIVMPDEIPEGLTADLPSTFYDTSGNAYTTMTSACAGKTLTTTMAPATQTKASQTFTGKKTYTKRLNAKAFKIDAKAQTTLTYTSSKKKVATVDSNGKVTIKGTGTTVITVTAAETSAYKAATYQVKIKVKKLSKVSVKYCGRFAGPYASVMAWKKMSNISGYQIQKSTSSKFAKNATKTYNVKKSVKKKTFGGLSNRKAYYYRIRAYKKIGKKKYYSAWSDKYVG